MKPLANQNGDLLNESLALVFPGCQHRDYVMNIPFVQAGRQLLRSVDDQVVAFKTP